MRNVPGMDELEAECRRIVELICSERVTDDEIERRIARLRDRTMGVFPDRPDVFDRTFGRRFQRLRTRFRPAPGLF